MEINKICSEFLFIHVIDEFINGMRSHTQIAYTDGLSHIHIIIYNFIRMCTNGKIEKYT